MKVQDLRIGNYVKSIQEGIFEISEILQPEEDVFDFSIKDEKGFFWVSLDDHLEPIPLTEEWLLKFGFQFQKKGTLTNGDKIEDFYFNTEIDFFYIIEGNEKGEYLLCKGEKYVCDFKYVHEFQNTIRWTTGKELEIKENTLK